MNEMSNMEKLEQHFKNIHCSDNSILHLIHPDNELKNK